MENNAETIQIAIKDLNLRKEVWIAMKRKETGSYSVWNSYHEPTSIGYCYIGQMHAQIKYSLAYLQDLIHALLGVSEHTSQSRINSCT